MPDTQFFLRDNDKRVKVLKDGVAVSASPLQSVYSKYLNFINSRFDVSENSILKSYDISLKYADKIVPKKDNAVVGTGTPRYLNFDSAGFNLAENTGVPDNYLVSLRFPGRVFVNVAGVAVNAVSPRKLNFVSGATATENTLTDSIDVLASGGSPVTGVKTGVINNGAAAGSGILAGYTFTGNFTPGIDNDGTYLSLDTTTTSQTHAEIESPNANFFRGDFNPKMSMKIKIPNVANNRLYIGYTGTISLPTNTFNFLDNRNGFGIRYDTTTDTTFKVLNNDAGAAAIVTDTAITPVNNTVYTLYFEYNNTTSTYKVTINGTDFTKTTRIPAATTPLGWTTRMQNSSGSIRNMFTYYHYAELDK